MRITSGQICNEFMRVNSALKSLLQKASDEYGLTVQQMWAMYALHCDGAMLMGAVAGRLHCDASNVTGIVDRLVARGLVERQPSATDRRAKQLALTARGRQIIEHVITQLPQRLGFSELSESERNTVFQCLQKLGR